MKKPPKKLKIKKSLVRFIRNNKPSKEKRINPLYSIDFWLLSEKDIEKQLEEDS